jgi:hypothetical protein
MIRKPCARLRGGAIFAPALLLALALFGPPAARSEFQFAERSPGEFRSWSLKDSTGAKETLSQFYFPVVATVHAGPTTEVVLSGAGASASLDPGSGGSSSLGGISDAQLQVFQRLSQGKLLLFGGISLPSGKTELSPEELEVSRALSHPLLGMRMRSYGDGLDLNGGAGWWVPFRPGWRLGLGAGAKLPGSYTLLQGGGSYQPAPQGAVSLALETQNARWAESPRSAKLGFTYRFYGTDQLANTDVFQEGNELEIGLAGRIGLGALQCFAGSQVVIKNDNVSLMDQAGRAIEALKSNPGTSVRTRLGLWRPLSERLQLGARAVWRHFGQSDRQDYRRRSINGDTFGVGPQLQLAVGGQHSLNLGALYLTGTAGEGNDQVDLSGYAVSFGFTFRPGL